MQDEEPHRFASGLSLKSWRPCRHSLSWWRVGLAGLPRWPCPLPPAGHVGLQPTIWLHFPCGLRICACSTPGVPAWLLQGRGGGGSSGVASRPVETRHAPGGKGQGRRRTHPVPGTL